MENRSAWLTETGKIEIRTIDIPVIADDEVLIKVEYVGICGSDMHYFETGCYSKGPIPFPHILGHECAGVIMDIGKNVHSLKIGDRVALEPGIACGECEECKSGKYNLCANVQFKSVPPFNGVLRDYVAHKASLCFKIPDNMSTLEGALIEPFAIGLHAAKQANVSFGKGIVILGTGCIGMMTLMACKAMGADPIVAVDIFDSRLEKAKELGADYVVNSQKEDCASAIYEIMGGHGADIIFETAGSPTTLKMAPSLCKSAGTIMMVGNIFGEVSFNFWEIAHREIVLMGIYRYCNDYPLAIRLAAQGRVRLKEIVTDIRSFPEVNEAFVQAIHNKEHTLKSVIKMI